MWVISLILTTSELPASVLKLRAHSGELKNSVSVANSLKLNLNKTELIEFTSGTHTTHTHKIAGQNVKHKSKQSVFVHGGTTTYPPPNL